MKLVGIPVVPTFRRTSDDSVIMTNLTLRGAMLYGKATKFYIKDVDDEQRKPHDLDDVFINLVANRSSLIEIMEEAWRLTDIATQAGIILPWDDPFEILIKPDGSWSLIVLDLEELRMSDDEEEVKRLNHINIKTFRKILTETKDALESKT